MDKELALNRAKEVRPWDGEMRTEWKQVLALGPTLKLLEQLEAEAKGCLERLAVVNAADGIEVAKYQGKAQGLRRAIDCLLEAGNNMEKDNG